MPSPAASQLTQRHRAELAAVTDLVTRRVRQVALQANVADIDAWWRRLLDQIVALVAAAWRRARDLGAGYLVEHSAIEGASVDPTLATWVTDQVVTSLRVTGPVEFKRHMSITGDVASARATMARTLPAATSRLVLAGERDTVMRTVRDSGDIVGWRRVTDADPCAFCAMLASRGAVYGSRGTAGRDTNARFVGDGLFKFHDGDECTAEPLYEHEDEPQHVLDLEEQWRTATAGTSGSGSIRAWRRHWDARQA